MWGSREILPRPPLCAGLKDSSAELRTHSSPKGPSSHVHSIVPASGRPGLLEGCRCLATTQTFKGTTPPATSDRVDPPALYPILSRFPLLSLPHIFHQMGSAARYCFLSSLVLAVTTAAYASPLTLVPSSLRLRGGESMSSTCKAVCAVDTTGVMKTMEVERRAPGPEDVDIDISFCGICHSDLHQVPQPSTLNPEPSAPAPNPAPCTLQTLHHAPCRLHPQPSTLNLPSAPSTLNPPTSAPNPQPRTPQPRTPEPSPLTP